jgi:hypothetical protein
MDRDRARSIAEHVHADDPERLGHLRRVARNAPPDARSVAWLHEALDAGTVSEADLLREGLTADELRALRLLGTLPWARSTGGYLARLDLIVRAQGHGGQLARAVAIADLEDRCAHPLPAAGAWSPPYEQGLQQLLDSGNAAWSSIV